MSKIYLSPTSATDNTFTEGADSGRKSWKAQRSIEGRLETAELKITPEAITLTVSENIGGDTLVSLINLEPDTIKIAAKNLVLTGLVTFTNLSTAGQTTISGSNITTGTLNASVVNVTNLNAGNMTIGTLNVDRIPTITASKISVTSLSSLNANLGSVTAGSMNIGSGTFVVTSGGALTATSASITGAIYANSGRIGNATFTAGASSVAFGGTISVNTFSANVSASSNKFIVTDENSNQYRIQVYNLNGTLVLRALSI